MLLSQISPLQSNLRVLQSFQVRKYYCAMFNQTRKFLFALYQGTESSLCIVKANLETVLLFIYVKIKLLVNIRFFLKGY